MNIFTTHKSVPRVLVFPHASSDGHCQAFYEELLEDDFRSKRFLDLAKMEGIATARVKKNLDDGKVHKSDVVLLSFV